MEIDRAALRHNFRQVRKLVGPSLGILAVVKADAYGHGLIPAAQAFAEAGATAFGVAEIEEGVRLRQAGITGQIVVMLGVDRQGAAEAVAHALTPVVYTLDALEALGAQAAKAGCLQGVQIKVDVGMGRLGLLPHELEPFLAALRRFPKLYLSGIASHFPKADVEGDGLTEKQYGLFQELLTRVQGDGQGRINHIANSATLLRYPGMRCDMVRPGISLYGCYPADWLSQASALELKPAMRFTTRVLQVKEIPAGQGISYGHRYVTEHSTRLAVLPVGYDDGYLRRMAGKAEVLLSGQRAPVRGMICMNACMADVTDIPGVKAGDEAVLLGGQGAGEIRAEEIARWSDTINYEILCLFGSCNRQVHVDSEESTRQSVG
ncbi:alanine racemase [Thiovibrio frasassiensis]|uniref:Alanine racemase n=1 Tax=Thiovibrio frasassiensis TaxID=2984131 RepID=A0A9X4MEB3_9BACT|nr:alanine racemase [Thiovibrio frasassiensis]MDG4474760.1 alanine racemase [Thiovibrio frasassiensis]